MSPKSELATPPGPSQALRRARQAQGLSLRELATRVGLPFSTLSKLENGKMALTYDKLIRLAQGLGIDVKDLVVNPRPTLPSVSLGRRSIARAGEAPEVESDLHHHVYPASDLLGKVMVPIIIEVQARSVEDVGGLVRHAGEEYLYVLSGAMELHSDVYAPLRLAKGDSIYFDSGMAHAYVRVSEEPCSVLAVCAGAGIRELAEAAAMREQ
jgi:transcriptional regulator with XRE-family HTH domain